MMGFPNNCSIMFYPQFLGYIDVVTRNQLVAREFVLPILSLSDPNQTKKTTRPEINHPIIPYPPFIF